MGQDFVYSMVLRLKNELTGNLRQAEASLTNFGKKFNKTGEGFVKFGEKLTTRVTLPLGIAGGFALHAAMKMEDAFTDLDRVTRGSGANFAEIRDRLMEISKHGPTSAAALAGIAEEGIKTGLRGTPQILGFTEAVDKFSVASKMAPAEAADNFSDLGKTLQFNAKDYSKLGSAVLGVQDRLGAAADETLRMTYQMAGTANMAGFSRQQIIGLAGAFTSLGVGGETGGNTMNQLIKQMNNAALGLDPKLLYSFQYISKLGGGDFLASWKRNKPQAIIDFFKGIATNPKMAEARLNAVGISIRKMESFMKMVPQAGTRMNEALKISNEEWETGTKLADDYGMATSTLSSHLEKLHNWYSLLSAKSMKGVTQLFSGLIDKMEPVVDFIERMPDPLQKTVIALLGIAAAAGPALTAFGMMLKWLKFIGPAVAPALAGLGGIALAMGTIAWAMKSIDEIKKRGFFQSAMTTTLAGQIAGAGNRMLGINQSVASGAQKVHQAVSINNKSAIEILLNVAGNVAANITGVNKNKGDANVRVMPQSQLGLYGNGGGQ